MTFAALNRLIDSIESDGYELFWKYDGEVFMLFYDKYKYTQFTDIPDTAFLFMELYNWQAMSFRCGVWQYYESGAFEEGKFEKMLSLLKAENEEEMASVYAHGIHDYANEKYQENGGNDDYPDEWFDDKVDKWISHNEKYISKWMYNWILDYKSEILKLLGEKEDA